MKISLVYFGSKNIGTEALKDLFSSPGKVNFPLQIYARYR